MKETKSAEIENLGAEIENLGQKLLAVIVFASNMAARIVLWFVLGDNAEQVSEKLRLGRQDRDRLIEMLYFNETDDEERRRAVE